MNGRLYSISGGEIIHYVQLMSTEFTKPTRLYSHEWQNGIPNAYSKGQPQYYQTWTLDRLLL